MSTWYGDLWQDPRSETEKEAAYEALREHQAEVLQKRRDRIAQYAVWFSQARHEAYLDEAETPAPGMLSGFPTLDLAFGQRIGTGEVMIFGARTGVGKTWFLDQMVDRYLLEDAAARAVWISLEMTPSEMWARSLCRTLDLSPQLRDQRAMAGLIQRDEFVRDFCPHLERLVMYEKGTDVDGIPRVVESVAQDGVAPSILVIDYLQLLGGRGNAYERASHTAKMLKELALDLDLTVLAASQLSRGGGGSGAEEPDLASARDSGVIEEAADRVVLGWRDEESDLSAEQRMFVKIAKNRHGRVGGRTMLRFTPSMVLEQVDEGSVYRPEGA